MDGLAATRAIRAPGSGVLDPDIPVIAMTAHAMSGDRERFLAAGMSDFLTKPLDFDLLLAAISRWSRTRATARPPEPATTPPQAPPQAATARADDQQAPVLNRAAAMARLMDNTTLLDSLCKHFMETVGSEIDGLERAIACGDCKGAMIAAHTLKGSAATIGAERFSALARVIEYAAQAGELSGLENQVAGLRRALQDLVRELEPTLDDAAAG